MRTILAISFASQALYAYASIGPTTDLVIANEIVSPDGFNRSAVLAGANSTSLSLPGPLIQGNKGDTFSINVVDQLTDQNMLVTTSIHWHGFFQDNSSWADGPVGVNQCPIAPGDSFQYMFGSGSQAGTFWYHSHHSTQYCDGLRGPLVVYDPNDPNLGSYDFDDETTVITLADWYHVLAPVAGLVPAPDATLINGIGRYAGGPTVPLTVISVLPNKRYRFRLVSLSCDPNFVFSIDGHSMTIIEVDSNNVTPVVVDSLQIFAGQRYSFILSTDQTVDNYWIRANPSTGTTGFDGGLNSGILRYSGADEVDPVTNDTSSNLLLETDLHPLTASPPPGTPSAGAADVNLAMNIGFSGTAFTINNVSFSPPSVPVLLQILSGAQTAQDLLPSGSVYTLPPNQVVELSFPITAAAVGNPHPFHLHGHSFHVVRSAGNDSYNYDNPVIRDVVSTGSPGDNVTIRFQTDNAGPWILHCHIDWHLEAGLAVVFAEDAATVSTSTHPSAWDNLCPTYDALTPQVFS
ncbi:hypothetical protein D9613_010326 [Agrocybe pediades]|uniref:laccase n=1 Tax=Agrocybe pediades TaxID=84607 RepID=A0A8H4VI59_9AGAR|nr:hypothetical protein D9613_010326 [Agrocybe pediades]